MATLLMKHKVRRIISSPAIRCVQTMQPLADAVNVPIELWDALERDADATPMLTAFSDLKFHNAVQCTHGEVLHQLLQADNVRRIARHGKLSPRRLADQRIGGTLGDHEQRTSLQAQPPQADQ